MSELFSKKFAQGTFKSFSEKPSFDFYHVHQTHSVRVLASQTPELAKEEADGIVGSIKETLAIKTADCQPVLIFGENGVAMLHAGWRGLAGGILTAPEVQQLKPVEAFIGPSIRVCCFEVTPEFSAHFPHTPVTKQADGTLRFDLIQEAYRQLKSAFPGIKITDSEECTCCNNKYPSYRRNKTPQRIWNLFLPLAQ